ncbi:MarR family winged helix-turn-helix transcriptional regulator [Acinetobacter sp. ANC 3832]|uniref:MarR family winged helix-turn-helix transcriptional regulator n=1 Tax=Acinetobacter sp. ANC 3832 TaxID=1977874 RepID=UPI000A34C5D4|nr:MarR family transcriptional regulator [Acinetobacter sp. ANC 3832]OTG94198.1 MarR family transcriptional regulator [Acinetobacter sp. ANC 3832]
MSNDHLKLDKQLCFPLYAASNLLVKVYRPLLEPLGLTYSQYLVMLVLWERDSVSVGDLGHCLYLDSGTLTPLLKRMESSGFINRRRDSNDERRVLVSLTTKGSEIKELAVDIPNKLSEQLNISDIGELRSEIQSLVQSLAKAV